ncbi:MAG: DUF4384 domain-containing protein [Pseudodonghicola sp.]
MTARPAIWAAGGLASLLSHGVLAAGLLLVLRPDPVPQQPQPQARLDVQAYRLERSRAEPRAPGAEAARQDSARGAAVAAGAIPQTRADAVAAPPAERLASAAPPAARVTAATGAADRLTAASPPPDAARPARAEPLAATALRPQAETAAPRPAPAPRLAAAPARPADLVAARPRAAPAAAAVPDPPPAPRLIPRPDRITAALAFQGGNGDVDPLSLAAFQSFVRPAETQAAALRDGMAGLLAGVPCGRLQVAFDPDTATLQVNGHVPEEALRAPVLAALRAQMGRDIAVADNMLILPRPQCGALAGIADVGLPQSTDQITNPLLIGEGTQARVFSFVAGERLSLDLTAPDYDAWIYVDYFDAGGQVLHLAPNDQLPPQRARPKQALRVGARGPDEPGLQFLVGPPYGQEIAVAFAASAPLYDTPRPASEAAAPYLDMLKTRIAALRAADPGFKGEWVYFFVRTAAE